MFSRWLLPGRGAWAQDVVHAVTGIVKHVDKDTKTVVVKAADGTEHTIKYTDQTVVKGAKDTGKGVEKGADDTGKGVEKGADDTGKGVEKGSVDTYLAGKEGTRVTVKYTEKGGEKDGGWHKGRQQSDGQSSSAVRHGTGIGSAAAKQQAAAPFSRDSMNLKVQREARQSPHRTFSPDLEGQLDLLRGIGGAGENRTHA